MSKRKKYHPEFKAKAALEVLKGEETVCELASRVGFHRSIIYQWKRVLLEGASGVFERGGRKAPEVDEAQVKDVHAKIGDRVHFRYWSEDNGRDRGQRYFGPKTQTLERQVRCKMIEPSLPGLTVSRQCALL